MGVGWAKGSRRGVHKLIRFSSADPATALWKKVWLFYFGYYCDVDLVAEAARNSATEEGGDEDANKPSVWDIDADVDADEAAEISRLIEETNEDDIENDGDKQHKFVLDSTASSLDGKRSWVKVRDLLFAIKHNDNDGGLLWEECCSLGVNNCSERKLEAYTEQVEKVRALRGAYDIIATQSQPASDEPPVL